MVKGVLLYKTKPQSLSLKHLWSHIESFYIYKANKVTDIITENAISTLHNSKLSNSVGTIFVYTIIAR